MIISQITVWQVPLKSHETYYMAEGKTCDSVDTVVVRIDTNIGISGWGEVCPIPHYLPAYANGVIPAIEEMKPQLIGAEISGPDALIARLNAHLMGHPYAKSAIDIAIWDIVAKRADLPLYTLLGGRQQAQMPLYHSITCIAPDEMARIAKDAHKQGIRQFQAKLGVDNDWQIDVARLRLVREAVGEGSIVYGDWNAGSTKLDAIRTGRAVADLDIMLEQPCVTIADCASVRAATGLPSKLDEAAHDTASLLEAYQADCLDAVAIKLSKFGGLSAARSARDLCTYLGTRMCIEDTWGSGISTAALLHLGASTNPKYILNVCDLSGYVYPLVAPDCPIRDNGYIRPPEGIGLGITPDIDALGKPKIIIE